MGQRSAQAHSALSTILMDYTSKYNLQSKPLKHRYDKTLAFVKQTLPTGSSILDLGVANPLSERLASAGYRVSNTLGEDLDEKPEAAAFVNTDAVTAFEIFEHLLNPYNVLKSITSNRLYASVPLSLWFARAYRHPTNRWDQHYHEFEDWQFDWLLEKTGWKIVRSEKWNSPWTHIGIHPLLRMITPRYYIVEAQRN